MEEDKRDSLDYLDFGICYLAPDISFGDSYYEKIDLFISSNLELGSSIIEVHKEII